MLPGSAEGGPYQLLIPGAEGTQREAPPITALLFQFNPKMIPGKLGRELVGPFNHRHGRGFEIFFEP